LAKLAALLAALLAVGCVDLTPPGPSLVDGPTRAARGDAARMDGIAEKDGGVAGGDGGAVASADATEVDGETPAQSDGAVRVDAAQPPDAPAAMTPDAAAPPDRAPDLNPPDAPPPDAPLLGRGSACGAGTQCQTGFCAQGRCCDQACTAGCFACDLPAAPGTCTPIAPGESSRGACVAQPAASCATDGSCDGAGGCRPHLPGTTCLAASCSGGSQTAAGTCNGAGSCQAGITSSCGAFQCDDATAVCRQTCSAPEHCQPGFVCVGTTCVAENPIGGLVVHDTDASRAVLWSLESNFQIGATATRPWADPQWAATFVQSLDAGAGLLLGDQWIRVSAESKKYTGGPQATITLSRAADLYMIVDARWGTTPSFTAGWTNLGLSASVFEGSSGSFFTFRIYRRTVPAGSFDLPGIGDNDAYNYFIVAE
jgi:hypothetical protein